MKIPDRMTIRFVEANNSATVVYVETKLIILFYNDKSRTIKTPNYEGLKSISIAGGNIKSCTKGSAAALKLMMLTETNVLFLWYEQTQLFYRCNFSPIRLPEINKILFKSNQLLVLSQDGCVYRGKSSQIALSSDLNEMSKPNRDVWQNNDQNRTELSRDHMIRIELHRVPNIDRAVDIFCDEGFASFAVLQEANMKYFRKPKLPHKELNFKKLYHDTSDSDSVHDVVFHVDGESFAAHKFIIYAFSPGLRELIKSYLNKDIYLNIEHLTCKMFELMLKYIYTYYFPTEEDIDILMLSLGPKNPQNRIAACQMFYEQLNNFQLSDLAKYVHCYIKEMVFRPFPRIRFNRLRRTDFPELYDLRIKCEGGDILEAHKCILVARLEYFEMMFMHSWAERTTVDFSAVPKEYMEPILDYLYSADIESFCKQNYTETFLYNMTTICDQYFIESLQYVCESLILDKISIRKCGEMLDFAAMYNCKLLKQGCLDFICQNLARVLCYRSIEQCESSTLKCLNDHYRQMFHKVFDYRHITPFSEAIEDELLLSFVDGHEVDLDYRIDQESISKEAGTHKHKELKQKLGSRHYEQQAISSMMKSLSFAVNTAQQDLGDPAQTCSLNDSKNWSRVIDKKEMKRKLAETALKLNNTLQQEEQPAPNFVVMSDKTPIKETTPTSIELFEKNTSMEPSTPLSKGYDLDLTSLTPQTQKLSQKQRKRLSSETKSGTSTSWRAEPALVEQPTTPVAVPNAWGIPTSPSNSFTEPFHSPPTGSIGDPGSFANMMRSSLPTSQVSPATTECSNSFSKILADERKQRSSYERMRNKSLAHTQIEETAIAELREFYNVDNIDDETITIQRKSMPRSINFSTWLNH
ncbi:inhibitor of Bruton tyrosine kinase isoform X2 [Scaptodrosophila lebanonensis]|nr:inhibitor of Bruton tyrosine kinase isoform X2 [Scaptodrosophila lebanonensis]